MSDSSFIVRTSARRRYPPLTARLAAPLYRYLVAVAFVTCVLSSVVNAYDPLPYSPEQPCSNQAFIGVGEIHPGDVGVGKTVFLGTAIEAFGVEVLGVLHQGDVSHPYIMVRVFGEAIERAGGIVDGMSGSPVYFDGRLAGAISHVYAGADRNTGLVTPIEPMLKLLSLAAGPERDALLGASPVRSPLLVSGMSGRALQIACSALAGHRCVVAAAGAARDVCESVSVTPGSAVSVQLVDGDIEIASVGTVTYVESNAFVAFGHHFEAAGTVDYIASSAEIVGIARSADGPFKMAASLKPVGRVTQDRFTGLAGTLGTAAKTVEVVVSVRDAETEEMRTYEFSVICDERFLYSLTTAGVLEAFDGTLGRIGEGTSTVSMSVQLSTGSTVARTNTYSDRSDIAMWSLSEISEVISLIAFNDYVSVSLLAVRIEADISPDIRTARIEAVEIDRDTIEPGDILKAQVVLRPYRSPAVVREVEIAVPADASPGFALLSVRGGSEVFGAYVAETSPQPSPDDTSSELYSFSGSDYPDLDSQLAEFEARPKGTDLIVDLRLPGPMAPEELVDESPYQKQFDLFEPVPVPTGSDDEWFRDDEQNDRSASPAPRLPHTSAESASPVRVAVPLDWVVYGYEELGVEIVVTGDEHSGVELESQLLT